ncbi:MAG: hypothetical protein ABJC09_10955 [Terriglobia bacterium]
MGLTDEDKQWFTSAMTSAIAASETRLRTEIGLLGSEIGRVETALLREIAQNRSEIVRVEASLRTEIAQVRTELVDMETELLTEFHKWARPFSSRVLTHASHLRTLN